MGDDNDLLIDFLLFLERTGVVERTHPEVRLNYSAIIEDYWRTFQ